MGSSDHSSVAPASRCHRIIRYGARGLWIGAFAAAFAIVAGVGLVLVRSLVANKPQTWEWAGMRMVVTADGAFEFMMRLAPAAQVVAVGAILGLLLGGGAGWIAGSRRGGTG